MAEPEPTEELPPIGGDPHNAVQMRPVRTTYGEDIPAGGYVVKMAKSAPLSDLKAAMAQKLSISEDTITFAYEGEEMDEKKTIKDNGIPEPGPAARRAGARVELLFLIRAGVEIGAQRARREAAEAAEEAERLRLEEEALRRKEEEERRIKMEEERKMAEKRKADAEAELRRQEEARRNNRCVLRCLEIGGGGGKELVTASNLTVMEVCRPPPWPPWKASLPVSPKARLAAPCHSPLSLATGSGLCGGATCERLNMLRDEEHQGGIVLLHNGQPLPGRQTLQDAGIRDNDEVYYFWGEGGEAVAELG
eukprot:s3548_g5.t3